MQRDGLGYMFYLYFHSLTFALQENGPFSKSCEVAAFPAAASRDEIEQLRVQAAAAAHSYRVARAAELRRSYREARAAAPAPSLGAPSAPREGGRAAAATEAIYQAGIAPPADAQVGSTADNAESRDEVEPLRFQGAAAIRACREARAAARREAIIQAVDPSNIPMCGVKYPNPRRNPLKRRKLE